VTITSDEPKGESMEDGQPPMERQAPGSSPNPATTRRC